MKRNLHLLINGIILNILMVALIFARYQNMGNSLDFTVEPNIFLTLFQFILLFYYNVILYYCYRGEEVLNKNRLKNFIFLLIILYLIGNLIITLPLGILFYLLIWQPLINDLSLILVLNCDSINESLLAMRKIIMKAKFKLWFQLIWIYILIFLSSMSVIFIWYFLPKLLIKRREIVLQIFHQL